MKSKLWTKYFILMTITSFCMSISSSMLNSPLPMYAQHIGANNSIAGLVTGFFTLSALLFRPLSGNLLDSKGRKVVLVAGIAIYCGIVLSYNWAATLAVLLALRFLHGIGFSAYSTASGTIAADLIPSDRLVEGIGYFGAFQTAAMAIGPSVGLALVEESSYHTLFIISFLLSAAGLGIAFFINYEKTKEAQLPKLAEQTEQTEQTEQVEQVEKADAKQKAVILERTAVPTASAVFFLTLTSGVVMTFLPAYAFSRGIKSIGIYFTVNAAVVLLTRTFTGKLVNRYGISRVIFLGMLPSAVAMVILSFSGSLFLFLLAGILNGLGTGVVFPILNMLVIRFCPKERKGAANATYYSAFDIGIGTGSVAGGVISQVMGYPFLYRVSALCVVSSFLIYYFVIRRQLAAKEKMEENVLLQAEANCK